MGIQSIKQREDSMIRLHISYNEDFSFNEFSNLIGCINLSFNDVSRELGKRTAREVSEASPIIANFEKGSIIFDLIAPTLKIAGNFLEVMRNRFAQKIKRHIQIHFEERADGSTIIDLNIVN